MGRGYEDLEEEIQDSYEPEDYYDYDEYIEDIRNDYGNVVDYLDLEIEEDDPRFTVNSS
jgi:hypothetical protein